MPGISRCNSADMGYIVASDAAVHCGTVSKVPIAEDDNYVRWYLKAKKDCALQFANRFLVEAKDDLSSDMKTLSVAKPCKILARGLGTTNISGQKHE